MNVRKYCTIAFAASVLLFSLVSDFLLARFYVGGTRAYNEWSPDMGNKIESDYVSVLWGKFALVNVNGAVRRLLGQHEMNGVVKLRNGWLTQVKSTPLSGTDAGRMTDSIAALSQALSDRGIPFLFAVCPVTPSRYDDQLPAGVTDCTNDDLDALSRLLREKGVDVMDFRTLMHEDGVSHWSMMYRTDHHWNMHAGFYAFTKICGWIKERTSEELDGTLCDFSNYTVTTWPSWHLGSRGQRTGRWFSGMDDFDLILPSFATELSSEKATGSLENVIISMKPLESRDYTSRYTYDRVLGASTTTHVRNLLSQNGLRVCVASDSFGKAVNPFLMLSVGELNPVPYDGLDAAFLDSYKPGAVIFLHWGNNIVSPGHPMYRGYRAGKD